MRDERPAEARERRVDEAARLARAKLNDARITAEIKAVLLETIPVTGLQVDVDTEHGIVHLRGEVTSHWQKQEAERLALLACPPGLQQLINELRVNPTLPSLSV